ncbi:CsiV family protein [Marinobacterium jannaschii]|uniref:CsiV family protein n=1 Tax=Marinobacterium jannaschii TaxID=64970 RepID=UPI000487C238|nr:CsiV family protein [Marinobacterium jannaschii]
MIRLALFLTALLSSGISLNLQAAEAPWYQVEVLIFANEDPSVLDDEFWPTELSVPDSPKSISLKTPTTTAQSFSAFERLPSSALLFNNEKQRIGRYDSFRVLFHAGWLQPVTSERYARQIHIKSGDILDNGMYELEGYISIDKGRYLHFRPDLYHSRHLSPSEAEVLQHAEEQPPQQFTALNTEETPQPQEVSTPSAEIPGITSQVSPFSSEFLTVNMNQGRRMRSKEIHYLDHPLMGILVLMIPISEAKVQ